MAERGKTASVRAYSGPSVKDKPTERIRAALAGGMSVRKTAAKFDVNPSTVQRIARPFVASVAGAAQANRCPARKGPLEGMLSSGRG